MTFLELVKSRYSVRDYNPEKEVENEKLDYILECARMAPSAVNLQPWNIYVIKGTELRKKINSCYKRDWILQAPLVLVVTALHDKSWKRAYDNKDHADIDVAIVAEHICLAACEKGLGSCWVCNFRADLCAEALNLPENEEAVVMIPLGYEKEHMIKEKSRRMAEDIVKTV